VDNLLLLAPLRCALYIIMDLELIGGLRAAELWQHACHAMPGQVGRLPAVICAVAHFLHRSNEVSACLPACLLAPAADFGHRCALRLPAWFAPP